MSTPTPAQPPLSTVASTLLPSILRTVVPIIYALLIRWGVVSWLDPTDTFITGLLTTLVTGLFYVLLRVLERYQSKIGWLLGYAQQPVYVKGEVLSVTQTPTTADTTVTNVESTEPSPAVATVETTTPTPAPHRHAHPHEGSSDPVLGTTAAGGTEPPVAPE